MSDWIEWGGAICPTSEPVSPTTLVEVRFRDGQEDTGKAIRYAWWHDGGDTDILAYRVLEKEDTLSKEEEVVNEEEWFLHDGGACPVHPNTIVTAERRDGKMLPNTRAGDRSWVYQTLSDPAYEIVAYRVVKEVEEEQVEEESFEQGSWTGVSGDFFKVEEEQGIEIEDITAAEVAAGNLAKGGSSPNQYRKSLSLPLTDNREEFVNVDLEIMDICQAWGFQQEEHNIIKAFSRNGVKDSGDELYDARKVMMFSLLYARRNGLYDNKRFWELVKELELG